MTGKCVLARRQLLVGSAVFASLKRLRGIPLDNLRLGVTTDEIDEDLLAAVQFISSYGLRDAELRNVWGLYNTAQPIERIREARLIFDEKKIAVSILDTALFKIPLPPESPDGDAALDREWALLDAAMERAKILGTDKLRIFAFLRTGSAQSSDPYSRIIELVEEAARRAATHGMTLAVENVGDSYVLTAADSAKLLGAVPADNLGLTWDPNNAAADSEPWPSL